MNNYKELKVWQKAIELTGNVYELTKSFPDDEKFGLKSQVQRSAVSIPSNIAEGSGRGSQKEFSNFLSIALGSAYELETQLIICTKLQFADNEKTAKLLVQVEEIQKMLFGLKKSLLRTVV